jgi:hypothetical protein
MTRTSAWIGFVLGLVCLATAVQEAVRSAGTPSIVVPAVAGLALLVGAAMTFRRRMPGQVLMSVLGLVLLARYLPHYFQTYRPWPALVVILLGSFTFGFGILGMLLDRYATQPRGGVPPRGDLR